MKSDLPELRTEVRACAAHLRLALSRKEWRGAVGNWAGTGTGSSLEFQDHRLYMPGDDPRHIDWAATARSDQAVMKIYREEVSPRIDLIVDTSASMFLTPEKERQTRRLLLFCVESALSCSASLKVFVQRADTVDILSPEELLGAKEILPERGVKDQPLDPARMPLRPGSLRLAVSDLLFPEEPASFLRPLLRERGRAALFAPFDASEESPDWSGNMLLQNCETGGFRRQRVSPELLRRYEQAYQRHVEAWRSQCRLLGIGFARIPSAMPLASAFQQEALPAGLVEPWA